MLVKDEGEKRHVILGQHSQCRKRIPRHLPLNCETRRFTHAFSCTAIVAEHESEL